MGVTMGSLQHEEQRQWLHYKQRTRAFNKLVLVSMAARNGYVFFLQLSEMCIPPFASFFWKESRIFFS